MHALNTAADVEHGGICVHGEIDAPADSRLKGHRGRLNEDDSTDCIRTMKDTGRSLENADCSSTCWIDLRRVVDSPLLVLMPDASLDQKKSPLWLATHHRLRRRSHPSGDDDPRDILECCCEVDTSLLLELFGVQQDHSTGVVFRLLPLCDNIDLLMDGVGMGAE